MHFESALMRRSKRKAPPFVAPKHGATVVPSEVLPNVLHKLERAAVIRQLGPDNATATLAIAIERVKAIEAVKETWIRIGKSCKSTAL